jgi:DNA-binding response OmpR family regulator
MTHVLIIEDDLALLRGLKDNLLAESYQVSTATDGEAGYRMIHQENPDVIILDLMLPGMSGYEVCRKVRDEGVATPILMLTARGEEADRVLGLDLGADDYVSKPFSLRELLARVRAMLRRGNLSSALPNKLRFGEVEVDFQRYEAQKGGQRIELTRREFGVLRFLAARAGEVVRRDELLQEVWGSKDFITVRTVDNHVASLRAKLEERASEPCYLLTMRGVGYKFVPGSGDE